LPTGAVSSRQYIASHFRARSISCSLVFIPAPPSPFPISGGMEAD
jgi:hypothetical protein